MTYRALIPVKTLTAAKSRLAAHLSQSQRATLVLWMLQHVIKILHASHVIKRASVVSADIRVLEQATAWGALALAEEVHGHNPALHAAAQREIADGATALLTISADLPLLQVRDIQNMVRLSQQYTVVLAPSSDGTGTNALVTRPPLALPYLFGPDSLQRYSAVASQQQLSYTLYHSIGSALDIDTYDDLESLQRYTTEDVIARVS